MEDEEEKRGYLLTKTPYMAKRELYRISGHWDHYLDGMFVLGDPDDETKAVSYTHLDVYKRQDSESAGMEPRPVGSVDKSCKLGDVAV